MPSHNFMYPGEHAHHFENSALDIMDYLYFSECDFFLHSLDTQNIQSMDIPITRH